MVGGFNQMTHIEVHVTCGGRMNIDVDQPRTSQRMSQRKPGLL